MDSSNRRVLPIRECQSDGLVTQRPNPARGCIQCDEYMMTKIAEQWAKDLPGIIDPTNVILDRLPSGYAAFSKARANKPGHIDRWVYGHPNGLFNSSVKFYVHFKYLMDNGNAQGCSCVNCLPIDGGIKVEQTQLTTPLSAPQMMPIVQPQVSAEQTQQSAAQPSMNGPSSNTTHTAAIKAETQLDKLNTYSMVLSQIIKLPNDVSIDQPLHDWQASWPYDGKETSSVASWPYRPGEVVLFERDGIWEAGLVLSRYNKDSEDHICRQLLIKEFTDAGLSHSFVVKSADLLPLSYLRAIAPDGSQSSSIQHALRSSPSISTVRPYRVRADTRQGRHEGTISCEGVFLGHELVLLGDFVTVPISDPAISPRDVTALLKVTRIQMQLLAFKTVSCTVCVHVLGRPYTRNPNRIVKEPDDAAFFGIPGEPDGKPLRLYDVFDPNKPGLRWQIDFTRIIGRYHGATTLRPLLIAGSDSEASDPPQMKDTTRMEWHDSRLEQLGLLREHVQ